MEFKNITTWSVSKGVATPKNPYFCTEGYYVACINLPEGQNCEGCNNYLKFEQFAQKHMFATDAPDGDYPTNYFGEFLPFIDQVKAESPKFGEWISVKDSLPEHTVDILLTHEDDLWVSIGYLFGGKAGGFYNTFDHDCECYPTHWMPLPSPPKTL